MSASESTDRRNFLKGAAASAAALGLSGLARADEALPKYDFKIAIDGWSFHKDVFSGKIKQVDLFKVVREELGIGAFNLVNNMLEVPTAEYMARVASNAKKFDIQIPLIMIDSEGSLGSASAEQRAKAVRNHTKWVWIASDLGCHSIRVNWHGASVAAMKDEAKAKELIAYSAEAFGQLVEIGKQNGINIIIENHGGPSSDPKLLVGLMKAVNSDHFGTLPDFGNFPEGVDVYDAIDQLMPHAKAVSAKCAEFDDGFVTFYNGRNIDFKKVMDIVCGKHGYKGWVGIEFEGNKAEEMDGVKQAQDRLKRVQA